MRRWLALLGLSLVCATPPALALESVRDQEIAQCLPGEISTWNDGRDQAAVASPLVFAYDHSHAPSWFTEAQVVAAVQAAATAWSQCGIPSSVVLQSAGKPVDKGVVRVQWGDQRSRGNFGLADLGLRTLSLGPAAFGLLKARNPSHDASTTLQMVISHEMGHLYGLVAHSRRCVDVTSYYDNGKGERCLARGIGPLRVVTEYRSLLPTACDIARCRQANAAQR